jgi:hypothetical protein
MSLSSFSTILKTESRPLDEIYYGYNHATLQRDFSQSLDFLSNPLQSATPARVIQRHTLRLTGRPPIQ